MSGAEKALSITSAGSGIASDALDFSGKTLEALRGASGATSGLSSATQIVDIVGGIARTGTGAVHMHHAIKDSKASKMLMGKLGNSDRTDDGAENDKFMSRMAASASKSDTVHKKEAAKEIVDGVLDVVSGATAFVPGYGQMLSAGAKGVKAVTDLVLDESIGKSSKEMRESHINTNTDDKYNEAYKKAMEALAQADEKKVSGFERDRRQHMAKHAAMESIYGKGIQTRKEGAMIATQSNIGQLEEKAIDDQEMTTYAGHLGLQLTGTGFVDAAGATPGSEKNKAFARFNSDFKKDKDYNAQMEEVRIHQLEAVPPEVETALQRPGKLPVGHRLFQKSGGVEGIAVDGGAGAGGEDHQARVGTAEHQLLRQAGVPAAPALVVQEKEGAPGRAGGGRQLFQTVPASGVQIHAHECRPLQQQGLESLPGLLRPGAYAKSDHDMTTPFRLTAERARVFYIVTISDFYRQEQKKYATGRICPQTGRRGG